MNKIRQICFAALYVAIIVAIQTLLSSIIGIEFTTLLMCVAAIFFPFKLTLLISCSYCLIQGVLFGFGDWLIVYFIYWNLIVTITYLLRNICKKYTLATAFVISINAFLIGVIFALEWLILYGIEAALSYYAAGFIGDLTHLGFTFISTLILYPILKRIIPKILK